MPDVPAEPGSQQDFYSVAAFLAVNYSASCWEF
jgi:hypothetical protein